MCIYSGELNCQRIVQGKSKNHNRSCLLTLRAFIYTFEIGSDIFTQAGIIWHSLEALLALNFLKERGCTSNFPLALGEGDKGGEAKKEI
jgi:hypothetical protein